MSTALYRSHAARPETVRASVTFPKGIYDAIELIAADKKVSVAWVIREAAERYVSDQWPLLPNPENKL